MDNSTLTLAITFAILALNRNNFMNFISANQMKSIITPIILGDLNLIQPNDRLESRVTI